MGLNAFWSSNHSWVIGGFTRDHDVIQPLQHTAHEPVIYDLGTLSRLGVAAHTARWSFCGLLVSAAGDCRSVSQTSRPRGQLERFPRSARVRGHPTFSVFRAGHPSANSIEADAASSKASRRSRGRPSV